MVFTIISNLKEFFQVEVDSLRDLSIAHELYAFCMENKETNFSDLMERLDDPSILSSSTLSEMNLINGFFWKIQDKMQEDRNINDYFKVIAFLSRQLNLLNKNDR